MVYNLHFFSSKYSLFHNSNLFGSCIIHILYTGCAKFKKKKSGAKRLKLYVARILIFKFLTHKRTSKIKGKVFPLQVPCGPEGG